MRVADLYKNSGKRQSISLEFSRPKNEKAAANLDKALDSLLKLSPDYVSVTFGAGGSTREGSFELIDKLKNERGQNVVAYIAGIGLGPEEIIEALERFKSMGIETVFVVRFFRFRKSGRAGLFTWHWFHLSILILKISNMDGSAKRK